MNYAQALNRAALRRMVLQPKKPNKRAGQHTQHFILGRDDKLDLRKIPRSDPVWSLISFRQLLSEHEDVPMHVFKKAGKHGIVGAKILEGGGAVIRRGYERPLQYNLAEYLAGYAWVRDYLAEYGVNFTSSSWASEQAFRIGLKRPIVLSNAIGRVLLKTSRGICYPGMTYKGDIEKWDIRSAYPHAMISHAHEFPARLIPIEPSEWDKREHTLVLAHVLIRPTMPMPKVPLIQTHPSEMDNPREQVAWLFRFELETLLDQFHHVIPIAAFKIQTVDLTDEFGAWNDMLMPRYINDLGFAGKILKAIANAFWGSFAATSINAFTWRKNEQGEPVVDIFQRRVGGGKYGGEHVAAWVNALVSNRVFKEFIQPYDVLYFDTDGGFCRPVPSKLGNGEFGQWKFEGHYRMLEVVGWQAYAAWSDDGPSVVLSGVPDATLQDLRRYGANAERRDYISSLMEDDPFSQITAVEKQGNLVSTIPPELATLNPSRWRAVHQDISPHSAQLGAQYQDFATVTDEQAQAFRRLAEYSRKEIT